MKLIEEVWKAADRLQEHDALVEAARLEGKILLGQVYMFKKDRSYTDWLIVHQHEDMFLVVPRDHAYLEVGGCDLNSDTAVLRCGLSHWLSPEELKDAILVGVDVPHKEARKIIAGLCRGKCPDYKAISDSKEYQKRMRRIERAFSRCTKYWELWQ